MKNAAITPLDIHVVRNALRFARIRWRELFRGRTPTTPPPDRRTAALPHLDWTIFVEICREKSSRSCRLQEAGHDEWAYSVQGTPGSLIDDYVSRITRAETLSPIS